MQRLALPFWLTFFLVLAGCDDPDPPPPAAPPQNAAPTVVVHAPAADLAAEIGSGVEVRYTDDDPDDSAETDVVALPLAGGSEIMIAAARPEQDGVEQTVAWDTTGIPAGDYRIEVRCRDGEAETIVAAAGIVSLAEPVPPPDPVWSDGEEAFARDIGVFDDGDVVVVGQYLHSAVFGSTTLQNAFAPAFRAQLPFVARYAPDGTLRWVRNAYPTAAPARPVIAYAVAVYADGSCVVAGQMYSPSCRFNPDLPDETVISAGPTAGGFLVRYDADGAVVWGEGIGYATDDPLLAWAPNVKSLPDGSCIVTSVFNDRATFRVGRADETTIDVDPAALIAARYDADGTLSWARKLATANSLDLEALIDDGLAAFADGSFAVSGRFMGSTVFGAGEANETTLTAAATEGFLARYDDAGTLSWALQTDSAAGESAAYGALAPGPGGAVIAHGNFEGETTLAPGASVTNGTASPDAMFVARFEQDGKLGWTRTILQALPNGGFPHLACDAGGNCVLAGRHAGDVLFWSGEAGATTLVNIGGGTSMWTAHFQADGMLDWVRSDGGGGSLSTILTAAAFRMPGLPVVLGQFDGTFTFDPGLPTEVSVSGKRYFVATFSANGLLE